MTNTESTSAWRLLAAQIDANLAKQRCAPKGQPRRNDGLRNSAGDGEVGMDERCHLTTYGEQIWFKSVSPSMLGCTPCEFIHRFQQ